MAAVSVDNVEWIRHVLFSNVLDIQQGYFNLNYKIPLSAITATTATAAAANFVVALPPGLMVSPLMCAVYYDNIAVVKELLYFNLDINAEHHNVKAADIALISTQPNSLEILRWLLHYGAKLGACYHKYVMLITDCEKLELISCFS